MTKFILVRNSTRSKPAEVWSITNCQKEANHFLQIAKEGEISRMHVLTESDLRAWTRTYQPSRKELEKIYG